MPVPLPCVRYQQHSLRESRTLLSGHCESILSFEQVVRIPWHACTKCSCQEEIVLEVTALYRGMPSFGDKDILLPLNGVHFKLVTCFYLQVLKSCTQALGAVSEDGILAMVQMLEHVFQGCPAGSLDVMTTAVMFFKDGWQRLSEKLRTTLCFIADAILPQLQVRSLKIHPYSIIFLTQLHCFNLNSISIPTGSDLSQIVRDTFQPFKFDLEL